MVIIKTKKFVVSVHRDNIADFKTGQLYYYGLIPLPVIVRAKDFFNNVNGVGFSWLNWVLYAQVCTPRHNAPLK